MPRTPSADRWAAALEDLKKAIEEERRACREMEKICLTTPKRLGQLEAEVAGLSARITLLHAEIRDMARRWRKRDA